MHWVSSYLTMAIMHFTSPITQRKMIRIDYKCSNNHTMSRQVVLAQA